MDLKGYIEKYWLLFIIVTQPILDIIAYFTFDNNLTIISFAVRSFYLIFAVIYTFIKSENKKRYILMMLPFALFSLIHIANSYRTSGFELFDDIRYIISVMQFPILTIAFIDYLRYHKDQIKVIEKSIMITYSIIFVSFLLSIVTNSYSMTYDEGGITGWFSSANTQSMILMLLSPLFLYFCSKKKNYVYIIAIIMTFILLFFNGTKSCYYTLIFSLPMMCYVLFTDKNKIKMIVTIIVLIICLALYKGSFTSNRENRLLENQQKNEKIFENIDYANLSKSEVITVLKENYLYVQAINHFGYDRVYDYMKNKISPYNLTDNRLLKRMYGYIIFDDSDLLTKFVGINHQNINKYERDLENDFTAIFYYYGYIGFALYCLFILYFAYLGIKVLITKPIKLVSPRFIVLTFTILLSLIGGQFSGALLRKTNANIYLSLLFALYYLYLVCSDNNDNYKIELKNNKITFLLLHLGYGGIETAVINTANSLCDKYDVELVSFYKLNKNQTNKINDKIKIQYLYDGEPNREQFLGNLKKKNMIGIFIE